MRHVVNRWLVDVGVFRRGEERGSSPRVDGKGGNCIDKFLLELDELVSRLDQDHGHTGFIPDDVVVFGSSQAQRILVMQRVHPRALAWIPDITWASLGG